MPAILVQWSVFIFYFIFQQILKMEYYIVISTCPDSSVVRAVGLSTEGCGYDSHLGKLKIFATNLLCIIYITCFGRLPIAGNILIVHICFCFWSEKFRFVLHILNRSTEIIFSLANNKKTSRYLQKILSQLESVDLLPSFHVEKKSLNYYSKQRTT